MNFLTSLDKLFILGRRQLKTLIPVWYTAFCTSDKWTEGRYRSEQCLVLIECTTELDLNIFIFLTIKSNKKIMCCECRGRIVTAVRARRWQNLALFPAEARFLSNVYWTVHHCNSWRMKDQLDVTCYFISLIMCSTCFGH